VVKLLHLELIKDFKLKQREQMNEFIIVLSGILLIFWAIWLPWMFLFFGSMALAHYGYPKLNHFILKYLYYFSKEDRDARKRKKQAKIRMYGTREEKVELHNKLNPNYQMMTDSEVFKKYKGVNRNKINIVSVPNFLLDTRTNSFYGNSKERQDDLDFIREKLNESEPITLSQPKEWVKWKSVETYCSLDVDEVNKAEKIFIFPEKTEYFRFIII